MSRPGPDAAARHPGAAGVAVAAIADSRELRRTIVLVSLVGVLAGLFLKGSNVHWVMGLVLTAGSAGGRGPAAVVLRRLPAGLLRVAFGVFGDLPLPAARATSLVTTLPTSVLGAYERGRAPAPVAAGAAARESAAFSAPLKRARLGGLLQS